MSRTQQLKKLETGPYFHLLLPLLSGLMIILAFPPFEQGYAAWFALLPLLWVCLKSPPWKGFKAGFIFSLPFTLYVNFYLAHVLYPYLSDFLATVAMIGLVLFISLFYGAFGLAASLTTLPGRAWFTALAVPSLWLIMEYLRSVTFLAYNVGYLGYTQWSYPALLNIASVYGYWGLPFLIVFFQVIIVLFWLNELRGRALGGIVFAFVIALALGLGGAEFQKVEIEARPLWTALIQGNVQPDLVVERDRQEVLEHYLKLTRLALEEEPAVELAVWPETVARLDFGTEKIHPEALVQMGREYGVDLLYGARVRKPGHLYNSITLFSEGQEEIPIYHKHRLVPFVEFFPAEQVLNRILQLDLLLGSYTPGEDITVFDLNGRPVAGVVCFESYFGDHMRRFAAAGSVHQFVVTNDAWFGESIGLEQHAQAAAIRAAETGTGVTQVANSGITISFDYRGRELFRSGKSETAIITVPLEMTRRETFYTRFGNYFPAMWAAFLVITIPCFILKARRESF